MKKEKLPKSRSWVAELMNQKTKPSTFKDRKKEDLKRACREFRGR
jgi:hypothetical protein